MSDVFRIFSFLITFIHPQDQVQTGPLAEIQLPVRLQAQEEGCLDPLECSL